jgi:hypothetical protein
MSTLSEDVVRRWLLAYAWTGTDDEKARNVECILSQGDWQHLDANAQSEPGPEAFSEGTEYELSSLYECHGGPHLASCPEVTVRELSSLSWIVNYIRAAFPDAWAQAAAAFQEMERREGQATP